MRIPKSVDYPWDQSKGIFATAGMHSLHCLVSSNFYNAISLEMLMKMKKAIYQMHYEYREDLNQTYPEEHMLHCFDTIREDIMCHADETPRYIAADGASTGVGQYRKCRDWNAYERWVAEHRSCFNYYQETINVHDPHNPDTLKNFMYCPAGSEYLPAIRKFFNKSDDWIPNPPLEGWLPALGLYKGDPGAPPEGRGW